MYPYTLNSSRDELKTRSSRVVRARSVPSRNRAQHVRLRGDERDALQNVQLRPCRTPQNLQTALGANASGLVRQTYARAPSRQASRTALGASPTALARVR